MKPPILPAAAAMPWPVVRAFHRKELGRIDEGRRVRPEFGEEIADAVDDQEGIDEFLDTGDHRDGCESSSPS